MREEAWLQWLQRVCSETNADVVSGIGDDAAVIRITTKHLVVCSDAIVEGVHFSSQAPLSQIGHKALARCLSDTAAMFAQAQTALVNCGVPPGWSLQQARRVYEGLLTTAKRFRVSVVGGDTVASPILWMSVTVTGRLLFDRPVLRSGARDGDVLVVTGPLGGAVSSGRHLIFTPRLKEAAVIAGRVRPHAAIDVSDGLSRDAWRMAQASDCDLVIEREALPLNAGVADDRMLCEGEDYELLMALSADDWARLRRSSLAGVSLYRIGFCRRRMKKRPQVLIQESGRLKRWPVMGYEHGRTRNS